ncbi:MAG: cadherin-like beta sandwich domain-containing protein [Clostridiales bacterium]|nr:cadherin-like beta sandwich domain-containing protein [Clostridiales bacterium]
MDGKKKNRKAVFGTGRMLSALAASFLLTMSVLLYGWAPGVFAASKITLSVETDARSAGQGNIVTVRVVADNMPGITSFGPVVMNYDSEDAEYISFSQGKDISGSFFFVETQEKGKITVSAEDQNFRKTEDNSEENEVEPFRSDSKVTLFMVSFRVLPGSNGNLNIRIDKTGTFKNEAGQGVDVVKGNSVSLPINPSSISKDATLAFLTIKAKSKDIDLSPEFNPNITDYSATVDRDITEVQVTPLPNNMFASLAISGNNNLQIGMNVIKIEVTAQDQETTMLYTIHITRKESFAPDSASLVDATGKTYSFLDIPDNVTVPEGFVQTVRMINGYSVQTYARDGVTSVLLYLFDGSNSPAFYFYNPVEKTIIPYDPENTIIRTSKILRISALPENIQVPAGFVSATYNTGRIVLKGYVDKNSNFICFMIDENGIGDFYLYNPENGSFQIYRPADRRPEILYKYMFEVFLIISIIEAVSLIITVYMVRRIIADKANPRPKRV